MKEQQQLEQEACSKFEQHPVRKICKKCRRPSTDHPMSEEDAEIIKDNLNVLANQPKATSHALYSWTPLRYPIDRLDEYFKKFPEDKVPSHNSEGQKNRLKRLSYQIPLSDISMEYCRFVEPDFKSEMENFIRDLQTSGVRIGEVKEWSVGMSLQCPKCLFILEAGELVVTTGEDNGQVYHPNCFICSHCQDYLTDLIHCSDNEGQVFCLRHYNDKNKKRCHACDELIFSTQYAIAGEKFYHKNHLFCFGCDSPLEGNKALEKYGELYCGPCYEDNFCNDCVKCHQKIMVANRHVAYKDQNWHYDCFTCDQCDTLMSDSTFEIVDEKFLCIECYNKDYAPRCAGCDAVFEAKAKVVKLENKIYHVPCFKCMGCQESIGTDPYVPHDGRIYCKPCYVSKFGIKCSKCTYSITEERGIKYDKKPYHEDCFTCCKCTTKLAKRPFKNVKDNWYCTACYADTFCKKCHCCGEPIVLGLTEEILYSYTDAYQWHSDCFICSACKKSLKDTPFAIRDQTLVCKTCLALENTDSNQETIVEQAEEQTEGQSASTG